MTHDKLTILLTLKGRPLFTFRWLDYMQHVGCPYRILISDGGADPEVEERLCSGREYPGLRYTYLRFPYDATHTEFYAKLDQSAQRIETPYVWLADNDDFLLPGPLEQSLAFLENNPDHCSCGAPPIMLTLHNLRARQREDLLYGSRVSLRMAPQGPNLLHDQSRDRIRTALDGYFDFGYWYNLHRTASVQRFFSDLARLDFEKYIFAEYLFSAILAHDGKVRHDAAPFYVRQMDTSMGACKDGAGSDNLLLMSMYPFWGKDVESFVQTALGYLGTLPGEPRAQAEEELRRRLARLLHGTYLHTMAPEPAYRSLADNLGLRSTLPWKAARKAFLASQALVRHYDVLGLKRSRTERILADCPEMNRVVSFLRQRRADNEPTNNPQETPA